MKRKPLPLLLITTTFILNLFGYSQSGARDSNVPLQNLQVASLEGISFRTNDLYN
jgi:hypothetical protein